MNGLVLLDRDGTNVEKNYLSFPNQIELLPGAAEGICLLNRLGLSVVVVTNQSAIGRGMFDSERLERIHQRLCELLCLKSAMIDAIYVCPHRPDESCSCRKPAPGLAERAADEFGTNLSEAFVVGDKACDVDLGRTIGATTILVRTGYGREVAETRTARPDYIAEHLLEAAQLIERITSGRGT